MNRNESKEIQRPLSSTLRVSHLRNSMSCCLLRYARPFRPRPQWKLAISEYRWTSFWRLSRAKKRRWASLRPCRLGSPPVSPRVLFAFALMDPALKGKQSEKLQPSTPKVIILSLSGLRCADVVRGVKDVKMQGGVAKVNLSSRCRSRLILPALRQALQAKGPNRLSVDGKGVCCGRYACAGRQAVGRGSAQGDKRDDSAARCGLPGF